MRGLDFSGIIEMNEKDHNRYTPTRWGIRHIIKRYLRGKITNDDAIIDIGGGKGKIIYFFSRKV